MSPALRFQLGPRLLAIPTGMFVADTNRMQYLQRIETLRCALCVLAVLVGLLVPTPSAAHGGNTDPNAIHACVQKVTKIARIVGVTGRCLTAPTHLAETAVHWAIVGPIGPAGTPGTPGTNGTNGTNGSPGAKGDPGEGVTTAALAVADPNCPNGGVAITSVSGTSYICNGGSSHQTHPALVSGGEIGQINAWAGLDAGTPWHLCYKGTRDSGTTFFSQASFHSLCDNKGSTFFVAKSRPGRIFGGYTARPWGSGGGCNWHFDANAFLFSLTNNFKHTQIGVAASADTYSVYDCSSYGLTFGGGHDFYSDLRTSAYANLGHTYACRVGVYGSSECWDDFAGGFDFSLVEIEVYSSQP